MIIKEFFALLGLEVDKAAFAEADLALNAVKTGFGLLAGAAVAATASLGIAVSSVTHHAGEVNKLSQVMGVTTDQAQEWSYASAKAGVNLMLLERGSERLSANLLLANEGSKKAAAAFAALGIKTRDASGHTISAQAALEGVVAGLEKMKDGGEKTARVQELLGKGGINLLPMLNKGTAAFQAMSQEARDLGLILDHETIVQGAELTKQMRTLHAVSEAVEQQIGAALLPVLLELARGMVSWWKENQKLIKQRLHTVVSLLIPVLKTVVFVVKAMGAVLGVVIDHWEFFAIVMGIVVAQALRAAIAEFITMDMMAVGAALSSVGAALSMAAAWLAAAAPVILLGLALDDLWGFFTGKDSVIGAIIDGWKSKWSEWLDVFTKVDPADPWWLAAIKLALREAKELIDTLAKLDPSRISKGAKSMVSGAWHALSTSDDQRATEAAQEAYDNDPMVAAQAQYKGRALKNWAQDALQSGAFGSGPADLAAKYLNPVSPAAASGPVTNTLNAQFNIDGSKSPEETQKAAIQGLEEWWGGKMQHAKGTKGAKK